ncbi:MAG: ATP-binding protein [Longimicrobiales bacterium]
MNGRTAKILMVDDRPENLLALEALLEPLGQTLVRANSGQEALRALLKDDFAVILLDVQMPQMNGFECASIIKTRERSRSTPIIFLTALNKEEQHVFEGYSVGAVDYMSKPLNADILRSKVAVFVELYAKNEELRIKDRELQEAERLALEVRHGQQMSATEARFEEILATANDAILTFGGDRRIMLFNRAAETMFGYDAADAEGMDVLSLIALDGREDVQFEIESMVTSSPEEGRTMQVNGLRANGGELPIELSLSRQRSSTSSEYTLIGRDIRDRAAAEAALRQSADELRMLNTELSRRQQDLEHAIGARSRFYASMSHELRTPINAILGYSSLMLDNIYGALNDQQTEGLERTYRAAKHLLELVNDILDLSKMEAGKIELMVEPVPFPATIEELFATVRPLADKHGSELTLRPEGTPITIVSDARRVRQILLNLFSNAIKFGEGKPIEVSCLPTESGGIRIGVTDQGPGIDKSDTRRIFEEFVQLSQSPEKLQEGTGLGLPISQRLAEMLGGSLDVESIPGTGSTFWLELPKDYDHVSTGGVPPEMAARI